MNNNTWAALKVRRLIHDALCLAASELEQQAASLRACLGT
jgi:hypothetical protein